MTIINAHFVFKRKCERFGQLVTFTYRGDPDTSHDKYGYPDPDFDRYPNRYSVQRKVFFQPPSSNPNAMPTQTEIGESVFEQHRMYVPYDLSLDDIYSVVYVGDYWEVQDIDDFLIGDQLIYKHAAMKRLSSVGEGG